MKIQILSVNIETKPNSRGGTYQSADIAFKNLTYQGKVEGKKIMSFGAQENAFNTLSVAQPGDTYDVTVVKNAAGFNDWTVVTKEIAGSANTSAASPAPTGASKTTQVRSTYETPEERAAKQIYIVRQSSLSAAINSLAVGSKTALKSDEVIKIAREYESYVFSTGSIDNTFEDVPDFPNEAE